MREGDGREDPDLCADRRSPDRSCIRSRRSRLGGLREDSERRRLQKRETGPYGRVPQFRQRHPGDPGAGSVVGGAGHDSGLILRARHLAVVGTRSRTESRGIRSGRTAYDRCRPMRGTASTWHIRGRPDADLASTRGVNPPNWCMNCPGMASRLIPADSGAAPAPLTGRRGSGVSRLRRDIPDRNWTLPAAGS
jgi:hypothetical protein